MTTDNDICEQPGGGKVESQQEYFGANPLNLSSRLQSLQKLREIQQSKDLIRSTSPKDPSCCQPGGGEVESQQEYLGSEHDVDI